MVSRLLLLALLLFVSPVFGDDDLCACIKDALVTKKPTGKCELPIKKIIGDFKTPLSDANLQKLRNQSCPPQPKPPAAAGNASGPVKKQDDPLVKQQIQDVIDKELQAQGSIGKKIDAANSDLKKADGDQNETMQELRKDVTLLAIVATLAVLSLVGAVLLKILRSKRQPAPGPDSSVVMKAFEERLRIAEGTALNALSKAAEVKAQIVPLAEKIEVLRSQSFNAAAAGAGPNPNPHSDLPPPVRQGGKPVAASKESLESMSAASRLVLAYNDAARSRRSSEYIRFESTYQNVAFFTVANARERAQNRDLPAIFRTADTGPYFAVLNPQTQAYFVFPSLGKHPWGLRRDAAMNFVFEFPEASGEPDLGVNKPATFQRDGEEWTPVEKGLLEVL